MILIVVVFVLLCFPRVFSLGVLVVHLFSCIHFLLMDLRFKPLSPHIVTVALYELRSYKCKQGGHARIDTSLYGSLCSEPGKSTNQEFV